MVLRQAYGSASIFASLFASHVMSNQSQHYLCTMQAWQQRTSAARPAVMASASAESGPTLRKPELVTKPVVREAPAEHEAAEKLSSPSAPAAVASCALSASFYWSEQWPGGLQWL